MDNLRKNKDEIRNSRMFLLENKLQSFYEEIKKLNDFTFKIKNNKDGMEHLEKKTCINTNSLNTNTNYLTEGAETNVLTEKSQVKENESITSENKKIEINKIIIKNPNKSKVFSGKKESCDSLIHKSHFNKNIKNTASENSPSETIIKCDADNNSDNLHIRKSDKNTNKSLNINLKDDDLSDYNLVKKFFRSFYKNNSPILFIKFLAYKTDQRA